MDGRTNLSVEVADIKHQCDAFDSFQKVDKKPELCSDFN